MRRSAPLDHNQLHGAKTMDTHTLRIQLTNTCAGKVLLWQPGVSRSCDIDSNIYYKCPNKLFHSSARAALKGRYAMKRRPYHVNPALQTWEEKNYLKLMAARINAAKSTVPKAAKGQRSTASKRSGPPSSSLDRQWATCHQPDNPKLPAIASHGIRSASEQAEVMPQQPQSLSSASAHSPVFSHSPQDRSLVQAVKLSAVHIFSTRYAASGPLDSGLQAPVTDATAKTSVVPLVHICTHTHQPSFKPITPDSPEPRLGYSPRSVQISSATCAESSRSSSSQLGCPAGIAPDTSPTVQVRHSAVQQPKTPATVHAEDATAQLRYPPGQQVKTLSAMQARTPITQPRYPAEQQKDAAESRSPAVQVRCPIRQQQQPVQQKQCTQHRSKAHAMQFKRPPAKSAFSKQRQHSKSPNCGALQGRSKAVLEWNSDFSIQYEDPVSIKDQERVQGNAEAAFALPPLPGACRSNSSTPSYPVAGSKDKLVKRSVGGCSAACQSKLAGPARPSSMLSRGTRSKASEKVPVTPLEGQQSAFLPPLLSASVHSQQDSPQLEPGTSCAASFLIHTSASSPLTSSVAQTSSPSHPLFSYSTLQQPQLTSTLDTCQHGNPMLDTCAEGTGHSCTECCNSGSPATVQQPLFQQQHRLHSQAHSPAASNSTLPDSLSTSLGMLRACEQQKQGFATVGRDGLDQRADYAQHEPGSKNVAAIAEAGSSSLMSTSRPWTVSNHGNDWQTQEALSVLNSADLAFLASRAPSSLSHSASCCDDKTSQEAMLLVQPGMTEIGGSAACSRDAAAAASACNQNDAYDSRGIQTDDKGSASIAGCSWCNQDDVCSTSQPHAQQLHKSLLAAPWQDLQSLADQCHDAECNVDTRLDSGSGSSADSLYSDDDWELPSNAG